jgi:hypothetical protein
MLVCVTVGTFLEGKKEPLREGRMSGSAVALFAFHRLVLAGQMVSGQPVVERFLKSEIPSLCCMTGGTCPFLHRENMWGRMTGSAVGEAVCNQRNFFSGSLFVDSRMTLGARNLGMFSLQSKRCPGVVEPTARLPVHRSVTR